MPAIFKIPSSYVATLTIAVAMQPFAHADVNQSSDLPAIEPVENVLLQEAPASTSQPVAQKFSQIPAGPQRKKAFVSYFLPIIQQENDRLLAVRQQIMMLHQQQSLSALQQDWLKDLAKSYKLRDFDPQNSRHRDELLVRVDIVSPSLALAQSANESGWGSSRFAEQGNNFFGQWCFTTGCGMVPKNRRAGAIHEVSAYHNPAESVKSYIHNLNSNASFAQFRGIRAQLRQNSQLLTGAELAEGLTRYSARGGDYVTELQSMIRQNKWAPLDSRVTI